MKKYLLKLLEKTADPSSDSPLKLAFLGDSVTHGCFEVVEKSEGRFDCIYDHEAVYHNRLKGMIGRVFPNCPVSVINAGISGGNAKQGSQRVKRDVIVSHPDLAVVCFGLNDVFAGEAGLSDYQQGLGSIFRQLSEAGIETVFMTPNMMCTDVCPDLSAEWLHKTAETCVRLQLGGTMDRYMQGAGEVCRQENVLLCDCYGDWKRLHTLGADITWLLSNHINHPTREMHALFAERLFATLFLSEG